MTDTISYAAAWKELRRREWLVIGLWLGYLPGVAGICWLISCVTTAESPAIAVAIAWMVAFAWACLRVSLFRYPQCNKRFYLNKYFITTLGRKCPHCGTHRYATAQPGS